MSRSKKRFISVGSFLLGGVLIAGFQNCSKQNFTASGLGADVNSEATASGSASGTIVPAGSGAPAGTVVVCDPLSSTGGCSTSSAVAVGLQGNLYSLPNGVGVQNYIDNGTKLNILIQLSSLDIPSRSFDAGFPGADGKPITDQNGNELVEYFAFDLNGFLTLDSNYPASDYQFATLTDDGSLLDLDGATVVNNDGTHSAAWGCSKAPITLKQGVAHAMRLRYYQGPRDTIALQVFWRPWSANDGSCNSSSSWTIVPGELLTH